jgi:hypothetical protein
MRLEDYYFRHFLLASQPLSRSAALFDICAAIAARALPTGMTTSSLAASEHRIDGRNRSTAAQNPCAVPRGVA